MTLLTTSNTDSGKLQPKATHTEKSSTDLSDNKYDIMYNPLVLGIFLQLQSIIMHVKNMLLYSTTIENKKPEYPSPRDTHQASTYQM